MQSEEVLSVQREQSALLLSGEGEDFLIGNALIGSTCLKRSQNIMPESAQFLDHTAREVLVGVKAGHQASWLAWMAFSISSGCVST